LDEGRGGCWAPDVKPPPSEYFKQQCIVSVEPDEATLAHVIAYMGGNNVVFSTDYPHGDSKYPEAVHHFLKLSISDADKKKILWDNCAAYYAM
jgi:predicted TIM-barrel fold metal-dependent hydrolase